MTLITRPADTAMRLQLTFNWRGEMEINCPPSFSARYVSVKDRTSDRVRQIYYRKKKKKMQIEIQNIDVRDVINRRC